MWRVDHSLYSAGTTVDVTIGARESSPAGAAATADVQPEDLQAAPILDMAPPPHKPVPQTTTERSQRSWTLAPSGVVADAAPSLAHSGYSVVSALNYEVFGKQNLFFNDSLANRCAYEKLLMRLARYSIVGHRMHSVATKEQQQ
jgi:hypothetical protein